MKSITKTMKDNKKKGKTNEQDFLHLTEKVLL